MCMKYNESVERMGDNMLQSYGEQKEGGEGKGREGRGEGQEGEGKGGRVFSEVISYFLRCCPPFSFLSASVRHDWVHEFN